METRASYVLIGAFTLAGILGGLLFFLWLAKVEVDRQYAYYDTLFDDVTGLGPAGDVRYNGLLVGRVVGLELDEDAPDKIRVRIEVDGETPIKTDTYATLEFQGVTGITFVALRGGSAEAPLLQVASEEAVPTIEARASAFQSIYEGGPELLQAALDLLEDVNEFVTPQNQQAVTDVLTNLSNATGTLETVLNDVAGLSDDLSTAASDLTAFTGVLADVAGTAETTLTTANETLSTATTAIQRAEATIDNATGALGAVEQTFANVNTLLEGRVPGLLDQVDATAGAAETAITDVSGRAVQVADRLSAIGDEVLARLEQAETALAGVDGVLTQTEATMKAVETVSGSANTLIEGEGAALVSELRTTLASAQATIANASGALSAAEQTFASTNRIMTERVPGILDSVEATTGAVESVATDASAFTERLAPLADAATARIQEAETTLAAVETTLSQANQTLQSIEQTSNTVDELLATDVEALVVDARETMATARSAIQSAATAIEEDVPQIMADVRSATGSVDQLVQELGGDISAFTGQLGKIGSRADATLAAATEAFTNANTTLAALDGAIATADGTLTAAEGAFNGVARVVDEDMDDIVADIREATSTLNQAIGSSTANLPEITARLRETMTNTASFVENLNGIITDNSGQLEEFMAGGLPAFVRFVQEARKLVSNLERLTAKIERDPARFLLGTQAREFQR